MTKNELKVIKIENRIALLESRTDRENSNIVRKLKRELRKYGRK